MWFPQGQRLVVESYLSLILQWGEGCGVTSHEAFSVLQLEREFYAFATDHKCKFVTYFCH